jgi:integrase
MRFTQRRLEELKCPAGKRDMLAFDAEQRGLGVRVTATGGKSYLVQYTLGGRKRRVPLGSSSAISLAAARKAAQQILGEVAVGKDPAADRKTAASAGELTLDGLISEWRARHLVHRRRRYAAEATRALRYAFAKHLRTPATALTTKAVRAILNAIADGGRRSIARQAGAYGRACYGWAVHVDLLADNPFIGIRLETVASRERVLTDQELRSIWQATEDRGSYRHIVRLLLLTGQRREEIAGMLWSELDADRMTWTIPAARTKNHRVQIVPLSKQAKAVLSAQPNFAHDDRVFMGFRSFSKAKPRLDAESGVTGWRLHDLRRTVATGLQRLGVRLEVTEAVLGHVGGSRAGIVGIYQRHTWADEKRAALNAWPPLRPQVHFRDRCSWRLWQVHSGNDGSTSDHNWSPIARRHAR